MPKNNPKWYDLLLVALTMIVGIYVLIFYKQLLLDMGHIDRIEVILGAIATILVLESVRRTAGNVVVALIGIFIVYAKFGHMLGGPLATGYVTWERLFQQLYVGADFMFGIPLRVVGQIVFGFIIFGVIFLKIGGGDMIMDLAYSAMGKYRGGPAKVAVIASSLFGSISGSAVANVAATGMITIPLMKKTGYSSHYAGAIEAVASTGGQIMPPIMGAAAFVLAEFLGLPYATVVLVAIAPAILYYVGLFMQIDLQAAKFNLKGLPKEQLPSFKETVQKGWMYIIPFVVLVYTLFFMFMPAGQAALCGTAAAIIISLLRKESRKYFTKANIMDMLFSTSRAMFEVVAICAGAGLIVGLVAFTGLGLSFSHLLTGAAGGNLLILAFLTAIASVILGMGMPTTAAYIMLAVLAAPAMVTLGVEPLTAHLFVFYFGTLSMLTPPVALSVFAAASISGAPSMKVAVQAMKLAIAGYVVPFAFIYNPGVVLVGTPFEIIRDMSFTLVAVVLFAFGFEGYFMKKLHWAFQAVFCVVAFCMLIPNMAIRIASGIVILLVMLFIAIDKKRQNAEIVARD